MPPPPPTPPHARDGTRPEPPEPTTGLLVIAGPIEHGHVRQLCDRLQRVIASSDAEVIVCDVSALPAGANAVEALARLQLTARRSNRHIRLQRASPCLAHLLEFVGLADVIPVASLLVGQRQRQAEHREDPLDVEEAVDRGDPPV